MGCEEDFHCNDLVKVNLTWFLSSFLLGLFDLIAFNLVWFERSRTPARVAYQSCLWPLKCGDVTSGTTDVVLRASRLLKLPELCPSTRRTCVSMYWVQVCFALLSLVRDVFGKLPKVCVPAIYKYYIWNKRTLSFIMAAWGALMMIVEIDKPTFP